MSVLSMIIFWIIFLLTTFFPFLTGSLQIKESQETDQGKYECVAENTVGTEYSYSAQLYVRGTFTNDTFEKLY